MNYQRYLFLFLRFSWLIVLLVAAALAGGWAWLNKQTPVYASQAVLEVVSGKEQILDTIKDLKEQGVGSLDALNTVVQTLSSNTVMLKVAEAIGRSKEWAARSGNGEVPPELESSLAGSIRAQLVISLKRGTRLIEINAEDSSPEMARKIADETVKQFLALQGMDLEENSKGATKNLYDKEKELREKLNESENKMAEFIKQYGIEVDEKQNIVGKRVADFNTQYTASNAKRVALEADMAALTRVKQGDVPGMLRLPSVAALPEVAALRTAVTARETEFHALEERYLPKHPRHAAAKAGLTDLQKKLQSAVANAGESLKQQYQTFKDEEKLLKELLDAESAKSLELGALFIPYNVMKREADADRQLYQDVLTRLKEVPVIEGMTKDAFGITKTPYKFTSKPLVNPVPVRPNKAKSMTMAGLLALALAVGLILCLDRLDSSIRTVDEAEQQLGLPVLAAVPEGNASKVPAGGLVMKDAAGSSQAEAFRTLRASISLLGEENHRRIILVTSAIPAEGKTFCSSNYAAALAGQGYRTLLIDADLRRPALTAALLPQDDRKSEEYRGLTDVLTGNSQPLDAVRTTAVENLWLLPSGRRAPNPSELLAQSTTPALLEYLLSQYDRIVVDSAPINAVSDTLSLAPCAHAVIVVLRFGKTPVRAILRALQLLKKSGAKLAGVVMNRVPLRRGAAYYYYYYGDPYVKDSVYGGEKKDKPKKKRRRKEEVEVAKVADVPQANEFGTKPKNA